MTTAERPLSGRRVLLTRPAGRGDALAVRLRELGARVAQRPTIALVPPRDAAPARRALARLERYDRVVFSSPSGVRFFLELLGEVRGPAFRIEARIAALGSGTARELERAGLRPDVVARDPTSEGLARTLAERVPAGERILLVRPEVSRPTVPRALRALGARAEEIVFYRNVRAPELGPLVEEVLAGRFDVVLFTSPSTLRRLLEAGRDAVEELREALGRARPVAIGPVTAAALRDAGLDVAAVAAGPGDEDVLRAILSLFA
jgi:uroporphyrinogen-III synthase